MASRSGGSVCWARAKEVETTILVTSKTMPRAASPIILVSSTTCSITRCLGIGQSIERIKALFPKVHFVEQPFILLIALIAAKPGCSNGCSWPLAALQIIEFHI
jgi:hypothetical protein